MYATNVDYYRVTTVNEAVEMLGTHAGAKLLAGGHSLIPLMKLRLTDIPALIDISRIPGMKGVKVNSGTVTIGPLTTHSELAASAELKQACPIISEAAGIIGDPLVRNRGTIGGNVAHADPASDLPTVLTALGAKFHATGPSGSRVIEAKDFFKGLMATALRDDEVLTSIEAPARAAGQGMAYAKFAHPASRYAVVGAAAIVTVSGGRCTEARLAVGGLTPTPTRLPSAEAALKNKPLDETSIKSASQSVANDLGDDIIGDIFASAEYRTAMAAVYVARALTAASQRTR